MGALLEPSPGRLIALRVVNRGAIGVRVVPEREHGARDAVDQLRGRHGVRAPAGRDVPRPDKDLRRRGRLHERRQSVEDGVGGVRGDRHPDRVAARGGVRVRGARGRDAVDDGPVIGGAVTPADRVGPRGRRVPPVAHAERERCRRAGRDAQVRAGVNGRRRTHAGLDTAGDDPEGGHGNEGPGAAHHVERRHATAYDDAVTRGTGVPFDFAAPGD